MMFTALILHAAVQKYEIRVFIVSYTCSYYVTLQLRCWSSLKLIELGKGNVFGDLEVRKNDGGGENTVYWQGTGGHFWFKLLECVRNHRLTK